MSTSLSALTEQLAKDVTRLTAERDALRAFAERMLADWPDAEPDGGDMQDAAVTHGLLIEIKPTEPCGEGCVCADSCDAADFANGFVTCYRRTPLLTGKAP